MESQIELAETALQQLKMFGILFAGVSAAYFLSNLDDAMEQVEERLKRKVAAVDILIASLAFYTNNMASSFSGLQYKFWQLLFLELSQSSLADSTSATSMEDAQMQMMDLVLNSQLYHDIKTQLREGR